MNKNRAFALVATATSLLAAASVPTLAQAQDVPATQNGAAPTVQRLIPLQNVAPEIIAFWVDPAHNQMPAQLKSSSKSFQSTHKTATPSPKTEGAFALPTGVQFVSPIGPQNSLLVLGTAAGIKELQKTIDFLDRPLRQIEIEAQFVQISDEDSKALGIDFGPQSKEQMSLAFVRDDFQMTLAKLETNKKAKTLFKQRVTAVNNLEAKIVSSSFRPAVLGFKDEAGNYHELTSSTPKTAPSQLKLGTSLEFAAIPTINNDDTVTLLMAPRRVLQLSSDADNQTFDLQNLFGLQTIANVRDGQTVALRGLNSQLFANFDEDKQIPASNVLMLVTARIVRRVEGAGAKLVGLRR